MDQFRPPPTPAEAEQMIRHIYATPRLVEGYASAAGDPLEDLERQIVDRHFRPGGAVLDIGCGGGREAFGLAARGFSVTGVDLSAELIARARAAAAGKSNVTFVVGSAASLQFPPASFDAAWLASEIYPAIPGRATRIATLRRLASLVRPGGPLVVFANVGRGHGSTRWLLDAPRRLLSPLLPRLFGEPGDRILRDPLASGAPYYQHHFDRESEVRAEFDAAGLAVIDHISSVFVIS